MRYPPGGDADFDAQMMAIAALAPEVRLAWLDERRRTLWELAPEPVRARWVAAWEASPHHVTPEALERARR
ncbi:MAG: hypothetical protein KF729_27030 [Sandaracinaceae bacterium]|nr:hypothetical protein [Sandaracinaceae bacterium]